MSEKKNDTEITSFLLVRHGESEANAGAYFGSQSDAPLSEKGRRQVVALTQALREVAVDAIYSSDLSRARDTVEPLARERGLPLVTTPRLRERDMGALTGLSFEEAKARYPELWRELVARMPYAAPPGGESHVALAQRVSSILDELLEKHRGQTILIGSHGVAINHMLRHLMGIRDPHLPLWFSVDNASISRVDLHRRHNVEAPRLTYTNRVAPPDGTPMSF
ncbi:MAG: histidine phosphatase family protein [Myxococcales bacterium]|nr:histidine phosphatase family protein [Polyangiaceae bacterium]MDW8248524.1 histidine phosphatase family protein [Myxococcales bacterium]